MENNKQSNTVTGRKNKNNYGKYYKITCNGQAGANAVR